LEDLEQISGPALTIPEMARVLGVSATFIRNEIRDGRIRAVLIGSSRKRVFRIRVREALQYARRLGLFEK